MSVKLSSVLRPMREKSHSSYLHWLTAEGFSMSCLDLTGCHGEPYGESVKRLWKAKKGFHLILIQSLGELYTHW